MPSVVMKEGILSLVCRMPVSRPAAPPMATLIGTIHRPTSLVVNRLLLSSPTKTAQSATVP